MVVTPCLNYADLPDDTSEEMPEVTFLLSPKASLPSARTSVQQGAKRKKSVVTIDTTLLSQEPVPSMVNTSNVGTAGFGLGTTCVNTGLLDSRSTTDDDSLHGASVETVSQARSTLADDLLCSTRVAELECPDGTSTVSTVLPIPES